MSNCNPTVYQDHSAIFVSVFVNPSLKWDRISLANKILKSNFLTKAYFMYF